MAYERIIHDVATEKEKSGRRTNYFWIPYTGILKGTSIGVSTPTKWKYAGDLGHLISIDDLAMEAINEQLITEIGNLQTTTNDGYQIPDINVEFHGGSVPTFAAFLGQDLLYNPVLTIGQILTKKGALICNTHDSSGNPISSTLILDLNVRVINIPGAQSDGTTTGSIQLFSDSAQVFMAEKGYVINAEAWLDNGGAIVNATAPDGVLTSFVLGTGNNVLSGLNPITTCVRSRPTLTDWDRDLFALKTFVTTTGVVTDVTLAAASFTPGTGAIAFSSAPADGTGIITFYAVPKAQSVFTTATDYTGGWDQWQSFNAL